MNTIVTPNWVTTDTATGFLDSTKLIGRFDRQWTEQWTNKPEGAMIGETVQVRIEQRWLATEGQALQQQAIYNQTVPITINHQFNIGMGWSTAQQTLEIEEVQSRYSRPAGKRLAAKWDRVAGQEVYKSVYFSVGSPGVNITDNATWQDAVAIMQEQGVPDDYMAVVSPSQQASLVSPTSPRSIPSSRFPNTSRAGSSARGRWASRSGISIPCSRRTRRARSRAPRGLSWARDRPARVSPWTARARMP